jgi:hypothetical protein
MSSAVLLAWEAQQMYQILQFLKIEENQELLYQKNVLVFQSIEVVLL